MLGRRTRFTYLAYVHGFSDPEQTSRRTFLENLGTLFAMPLHVSSSKAHAIAFLRELPERARSSPKENKELCEQHED